MPSAKTSIDNDVIAIKAAPTADAAFFKHGINNHPFSKVKSVILSTAVGHGLQHLALAKTNTSMGGSIVSTTAAALTPALDTGSSNLPSQWEWVLTLHYKQTDNR